jgi:hypothetical protein
MVVLLNNIYNILTIKRTGKLWLLILESGSVWLSQPSLYVRVMRLAIQTPLKFL